MDHPPTQIRETHLSPQRRGDLIGAAATLPELLEVRTVGSTIARRTIRLFAITTVFGAIGIGVASVLVTARATQAGFGQIRPATIRPIRAPAEGMVIAVLVRSGDTVRANQTIVQLDTLAAAAKLAQLRAAYADAQRQFKTERANYPVSLRRAANAVEEAQIRVLEARSAVRRAMSDYNAFGDLDSLLHAYKVGSHAGLDPSITALLAATVALSTARTEASLDSLANISIAERAATLSQLAIQVSVAEEERRRLAIRSPTDGIVKTDHLEQLPGAHVQDGEQILQIAGLEGWEADLYLSEQALQDIQLGDSAVILLRAFRGSHGDKVRGSVAAISPVPRDSAIGPAIRQYRVTLALSSTDIALAGDGHVRWGFFAEGKIFTGRGTLAKLVWRYARRQF